MTPAFADRLKQMGVAQPNTTFSPSSTAAPFPVVSLASPYPPSSSNATLGVLKARRRLQAHADEEFRQLGKPGSQGREHLDVGIVKNILTLRQRGESAAEIESRLKLKPGVVSKLGPLGIVSPV